jgi:regulatory protein YycI of two-component signal transduction system YycFG
MASQEEKKQKILTVILVICFLVMAIVLIWNFAGPKTSNQPIETISETNNESFPYLSEESGSLPNEEELVSMELDLKVLESAQFKDLRSHGDLPVKVGQTGRPNPFLPY